MNVVRPTALPVRFESIPAELRNLDRWMCWTYTYRLAENKWTKPPINPATNYGASSTDPGTWNSFDFVRKNADRFDGIGFAMLPGLAGIDLDHCVTREGGKVVVAEWAREIIERFDTYTEVSPSGTGIRMFARGKLPGAGKKVGDKELYDDGRYLTVTGWAVTPGKPIAHRQEAINQLHAELVGATKGDKGDQGGEIEVSDNPQDWTEGYLSDSEVIQRARDAANGERFGHLWSGQWQTARRDDGSRYPSQSEADAALCVILCFWCSRGLAQVDRLFRRSGLYRSEKWEREDYRTDTLVGAAEHCTEVYTPDKFAGVTDDQLAEATRIEPNWYQPPERTTAMNYLIDLTTHQSVKRDYDWIVEGCLYQGGLFVVAGHPGAGKSVLLQQMTTDVQYGASVFDRRTSPRPVIWLDWDGGGQHYELQRDIALKGRDPAAINHLYRYGTTTPELPTQKPLPAFVTPDFLDIMTGAYPERKGIVVIDCMRSAFCAMPSLGENWENNNGLMYKLVGSLRDWCHKSKWTILLIHHFNKSGGVSGASGIEGAADVVWDFDREKGQTHTTLLVRRRVPREEKLHLEYEDDLYVFEGRNKDVQERDTVRQKLDMAEVIFSLLRESREPLSGRDIEDRLRKGGLKFKNTLFRTVMTELVTDCIVASLGVQKGNTLTDGAESRMTEYRIRMSKRS